jgi:hypothetical protein
VPSIKTFTEIRDALRSFPSSLTPSLASYLYDLLLSHLPNTAAIAVTYAGRHVDLVDPDKNIDGEALKLAINEMTTLLDSDQHDSNPARNTKIRQDISKAVALWVKERIGYLKDAPALVSFQSLESCFSYSSW